LNQRCHTENVRPSFFRRTPFFPRSWPAPTKGRGNPASTASAGSLRFLAPRLPLGPHTPRASGRDLGTHGMRGTHERTVQGTRPPNPICPAAWCEPKLGGMQPSPAQIRRSFEQIAARVASSPDSGLTTAAF
jgi:hypothetical protein